jgi:subtilisin family serine protease
MRLTTRRPALTAIAGLTAVIAFTAPTASAAPPIPEAPLAPLIHVRPTEPGQYIVTLAPGTDPMAVAGALGVTPHHVYRDAMLGFAAVLTEDQVTQARGTAGVRAVEEDGTVAVPRDEQTPTRPRPVAADRAAPATSWGLERINHRELGTTGFSVTSTGATVTSYIVDTGIEFAHPEFGGRAVRGVDEVGDGRDGADCAGHGTHVAGTVGGATTGVARQVKLVSVRVLGCDGSGTNSGIIAGLNWIAANVHKPAVANISIGGPWSYALNSSVDALSRAGVFTVVAAGNEDADACLSSPSGSAEAFAVAATDRQDARADFSNYGNCVDVNAPGVDITSAYLGGTYTELSGTSMSAPHVTGIAALYKDAHGDTSSTSLASWLEVNATSGIPATVPTGTPQLLAFTAGL